MTKESCEFQAQLVSWTLIHELPDAWPSSRLLQLLESLEMDGVSELDAPEMALLALQDLEPDEAAERVLAAAFGNAMRPGVRQGLVHDLKEEQPWENFVDLGQQAEIFNVAVLLQRVFPRDFDKPDAASAVLRLNSASELGQSWLDAPVLDPALFLRILAAGMDDRAVLPRLFREALDGPSFPEASAILWRIARRTDGEHGREFELISNQEWLDPLRDLERWSAAAWPDALRS